MSGRNVEHNWWKTDCCLWIFTVTNTCHMVWLFHQGTRQIGVCDIQRQNKWSEPWQYVEILHIVSFLLVKSCQWWIRAWCHKPLFYKKQGGQRENVLFSIFFSVALSSVSTLMKSLLLMLFFWSVFQAIRANGYFFKVIDSQKLMQVLALKEQKLFSMFLKQMSNINSFSCLYKPDGHVMPAPCQIWY